MALPPQTRDQGEPHPLGGRRAFRAGLIGCLASIVIGGLVTLLAGGDLRGAGVALLVLGASAFVTLVILSGLEAMALRRRASTAGAPPAKPPTQSNGHGAPPEFRRSRRRT